MPVKFPEILVDSSVVVRLGMLVEFPQVPIDFSVVAVLSQGQVYLVFVTWTVIVTSTSEPGV